MESRRSLGLNGIKERVFPPVRGESPSEELSVQKLDKQRRHVHMIGQEQRGCAKMTWPSAATTVIRGAA